MAKWLKDVHMDTKKTFDCLRDRMWRIGLRLLGSNIGEIVFLSP